LRHRAKLRRKPGSPVASGESMMQETPLEKSLVLGCLLGSGLSAHASCRLDQIQSRRSRLVQSSDDRCQVERP
jgi:hypothetical protein